jgi:SAM-dependent methyltransferase
MGQEKFNPSSYWEDRLQKQYNFKGVGDIGLSRSYNEALYEVRGRVFRRLLHKLPLQPAQTRVLDVGSGTGFYVQQWKRWGATSITGSDLTRIAIGQLGASYPDAVFLQLDIGEPLPSSLAARQFDVISCFDVLFHIVDDARYKQALRNLAALACRGGYLLYSDNFRPETRRARHQVERSEHLILNTLREAGFEIRSRTPMFVLMNDPVRSHSRLLRRWFRLVYQLAARSERYGAVMGSVLKPVERVATRLVRSGPSTEILVCQRV